MSWETHEAAKKIANGWYLELKETRERNAVLGRENAKLREQLEYDRQTARSRLERIDRLKAENANLLERITTQKQTIQAYRDESREWREVAERVQAENTKLQRLVTDIHKALFALSVDHCQACPREDACVFIHKSFDDNECAIERDMQELGVEV